MANIKVCYDSAANAASFQIPALGQGGMVFVNEMQAVAGDAAGTVSVVNTQRGSDSTDFLEVYDVPFDQFVDENDQPHGVDTVTTVDAINAILRRGGSPVAGELPVITSATTVNMTEGDVLNYELTADYGVGFEWDGLPAGIVPVEGNVRKLVGGSGLTTGTYQAQARAVNYNGEDVQTIDFVVSAPAFNNTKAVKFNNNDYLGANAALLEGILGRPANGSGASDAWTVSMYFKAGTASNANQTILYFGAATVANDGYMQIKYDGAVTNGRCIALRYGTNNNRLGLRTNPETAMPGDRIHLMVTYDGGTTGVASGSLNAYYSRFKVFIDGVEQALSGSHNNYGYSGDILGDNFRLGRWNNGQSLRNDSIIDELAIWGSDQSGNVGDIYNGGTAHDLQLLDDGPDHYWRMGDGDTYPIIQDVVGFAHFQMYNMSAADIVNDVT